MGEVRADGYRRPAIRQCRAEDLGRHDEGPEQAGYAQALGERHLRSITGCPRHLLSLFRVAEQTVTGRTDLSEAVIRNFFKLIAYKDEYEVARMLTDPAFLASVRAQVPGGENLTFKLHPPMLKALGREKKIGMGPRTHVVLRVLARGKWPWGTPLDPFGHSHIRRIERRLVAHYERTITDLLRSLTSDSYERAVAVASAPDLVRGYEEVKIRSLATYSARLTELGIEPPQLSL
jgi:indolepyruvate ferredoxin oxidoreductase